MNDIVERLRRSNNTCWTHERADLVLEAADEIERLRADGLRTAMKRLAAWIPPNARAPLRLP